MPSTQQAWCAAARGKNLRQVEELVSGHQVGDHPDDPKRPELRTWTIKLKLLPEAYARWRQAQKVLADERSERLDDSDLVSALADAVLEARGGGGGDGVARARYQIMMTVCSACRQGWQHGAGKQLGVDAATVERAWCDAQHIGSTEDDVPVRASQDIPPRVRRFVWHRDGGRCTAPGCRSTRCLEIHHRHPRALGGDHDPANLCLLCSACHAAIHHGTLVLDELGGAHRPNEPTAGVRDEGSAANDNDAGPNLNGATNANDTVDTVDAIDAVDTIDMITDDAIDVDAVSRSVLDQSIRIAQARDALVGLGWKSAIARNAVETATSHVGRDAPLEAIIREALRRCPRPRT
jgi:hypothetical protein